MKSEQNVWTAIWRLWKSITGGSRIQSITNLLWVYHFFPSVSPLLELSTTWNPEVSIMIQKREIQKKPSSSGSRTKKGTLKAQGKWGKPLGYFSPNSHNPVLRSPEVGGRMGVAATAPPTGTGNGKPPGVKNLPLHSMKPFLQVGRSNLFLSFLFCLQESHSIKLFMNSWVHTQAV